MMPLIVLRDKSWDKQLVYPRLNNGMRKIFYNRQGARIRCSRRVLLVRKANRNEQQHSILKKRFAYPVMFLIDGELYKYKQSGNTEKGLVK